MPSATLNEIRDEIRGYPDFPKKGILFRDIFSVLRKPALFEALLESMLAEIKKKTTTVNAVTALESRGFLFGPYLAMKLNVPFIPLRKKGKLPGECVQTTYALEYGHDVLEMQKDALKAGDNVVIVDDLLATGGTMNAAIKLIRSTQAEVVLCMVAIELPYLKGRSRVDAQCHTMFQFDDE